MVTYSSIIGMQLRNTGREVLYHMVSEHTNCILAKKVFNNTCIDQAVLQLLAQLP